MVLNETRIVSDPKSTRTSNICDPRRSAKGVSGSKGLGHRGQGQVDDEKDIEETFMVTGKTIHVPGPPSKMKV